MANSRKLKITTLALFGVAALVAGMGGCASETTRDAQIRADVSPELETLHERQVDMDNAGALMADENGRMFMQDLGRFWLTNRSSHLAPEPTIRP